MAGEDGTEAVQDFLAILETHKKNCERAGKYIEADIAKKRLEELRAHEHSRRDEALRSQQIAQRLGIEEAHMLEFQQFNSMWDRTMKEYEERAQELLEAMRQRHELDAHEFRAKHAAAPDVRAPKHSPKLLDLRRSEAVLAKSGEYAEAHKVKVRADALEANESGRAVAEREHQLLNAEGKILQRQEQEVTALRQRVQTGAEEQRVARQQDLERLLRRYHNIKAELESQQAAELHRQRRGVALAQARGGMSSQVSGMGGMSSRASLASGVGSRPGSARPMSTRRL